MRVLPWCLWAMVVGSGPGCGDDDDVADGDADADADADADGDGDGDADGDGDGDADGDADADVTTIASYSGSGSTAYVVRTIHADGSESLHGETEISWRGVSPYVARLIEDVELDPAHHLAHADLQESDTVGTTEIRKRVILDPGTGEVRVTRPSGAFTFTVPTDAPWGIQALVPVGAFGFQIRTPVEAWVASRIVDAESAYFVLADEGRFVPFAGAEIATALATVVELDDQFVRTVTTEIAGTMERFDGEDFGDLEDFEVPESDTWLPPRDCAYTSTVVEDTVASTDGAQVRVQADLPEGDGPFPFVVLMQGTPGGPIDGFLQACMVRRLLEAGAATVRYDDRGYGETPGDLLVDLTFDHRSDDAAAVVQWAAEQPDLAPDRLFALGHSEGAGHACRAAERVPALDGLLLLSAHASTGYDLGLEQGATLLENLGFTADVVDAVTASNRSTFDQVLAGTYPEPTLSGLSVDYTRQFLAFDGAAAAVAAARPTAIFAGERDWTVAAHNADDLATALTEAGVADVTEHRYEGLDHFFVPIPDGLASFNDELYVPLERDERLYDDVVAWIQAH